MSDVRKVISRSTIQEVTYSAPAKVSVGSGTTEVAAANDGRRYLAIVNDDDEPVYLAIGADAVMNKGIRLNASGGVFEMTGLNLSLKAVNAICSSGSKNVTVQEATQ